MTVKIAITGRFRRGKDTLAAMLQELLVTPTTQLRFADALKTEVAEMFVPYTSSAAVPVDPATTRTLHVSPNFIAIVDANDYDRLPPRGWWLTDRGYAAHDEVHDWVRSRVLLHRLIMGIDDPDVQVDHVNGNPLDCRKSNLRLSMTVANRQNMQSANVNSKTGYRGVVWSGRKGKYVGYIKVYYATTYVGAFDTAEEAYNATNKARVKAIESVLDQGNKGVYGPAFQFWGEWRRWHDDECYWINHPMFQARYQEAEQAQHHIVIADMRHHNEAAWCKRNGFYLIRIEGPCRTEGEARDPNHASERFIDELEVDAVVSNESSLTNLNTLARAALMYARKQRAE